MSSSNKGITLYYTLLHEKLPPPMASRQLFNFKRIGTWEVVRSLKGKTYRHACKVEGQVFNFERNKFKIYFLSWFVPLSELETINYV
jgi:hypothetical protein